MKQKQRTFSYNKVEIKIGKRKAQQTWNIILEAATQREK